MQLLTSKIEASTAAARWKNAYRDGFNEFEDTPKQTIWKKLKSLGPNPEPADVNAIIGNNSWASVRCDECDKEVEAAVQLGETPNYESSTAIICLSCLKAARRLFKTGP